MILQITILWNGFDLEVTMTMPLGAVLLADKGYADVVPFPTPFRNAQIRRMPMPDQRRARRFNRPYRRLSQRLLL